MRNIQDLIAQAICKADRRFFFENYDKQAAAVLETLSGAGLVIVPEQPTEAMTEAGVKAIRDGRTRPADLAADIYRAMSRAG